MALSDQQSDGFSLSKFQLDSAEFLRGATFRWMKWRQIQKDWTHDHCAICHAYIREDALSGDYSEAFATPVPTEPSEARRGDRCIHVPAPVENGAAWHWVCVRCFESLKERFDWKIEGLPDVRGGAKELEK